MGVFVTTGKPRGGKSFIAVKMLYQVLLMEKDHRPIVTNLPLKLDVIAEELRIDLKLETVPDLTGRIRILTDGETSEFWLFEPNHEFLNRKQLDFRKWKMNVPDMEDRGQRGCWYFIDEVHIPFPAQFGTRYEGQESLEADLRWFITQHGKMNIDVNLITQHPEQMNKALRRMAQEYLHVRNLSREPYLGFRIGNMFRYVRSLNSPSSANPAAFDSGFHPMDFKKYGKMYDTTQGVGIVGTFIHEQPKRGRPLWILIFPLIAFFCFLYWLVFYAPAMTTRMAKGFSGAAAKHVQSATETAFKVPQTINTNETQKIENKKDVQTVEKTVKRNDIIPEITRRGGTNLLQCVGYVIRGKNATAYLSDGQIYETETGELQQIKLHSVTINGVSIPMGHRTAQTEFKGIAGSPVVDLPQKSQKITIDYPIDSDIISSQ